MSKVKVDEIESSSGGGLTAKITNNLSNRNLIINGAMQVAQRGTSSTDVGLKTIDRWTYNENDSSGAATQSQVTDAPEGFGYSYKIDCTTANASPAADVYNIIFTTFEGQDLQQIKKGTSNAKQLTASFWVKGNAAATYTCELRDHDNTRFCSQTFNVTTSWSRVTITFAADTTGAFDNDNNLSLYLFIWLGGGSNYSGGTWSSNTWHTADNQRIGDNQTNFFDSTNRTFFLTGVQLEVSDYATEFEHLSYADELRRCQRYYFRQTLANNDFFGMGFAANDSFGDVAVQFPVSMRAKPTGLEQTGTAGDYKLARRTASTTCSAVPTFANSTENFGNLTWTTGSGMNGGEAVFLQSTGDDHYIGWTGAEL